MSPQILGTQGRHAAGGDDSALAALFLLPDRRHAFGSLPAIHVANNTTTLTPCSTYCSAAEEEGRRTGSFDEPMEPSPRSGAVMVAGRL